MKWTTMKFEYARVKLDKNNFGWFPVTQGHTGKTVEFDLIFEVAS